MIWIQISVGFWGFFFGLGFLRDGCGEVSVTYVVNYGSLTFDFMTWNFFLVWCSYMGLLVGRGTVLVRLGNTQIALSGV